MTRTAPNYIWRKWATAEWLKRHEKKLHRLTNGEHALIERPDRSLIAAECFCPNLSMGRGLVTALGGSLKRLEPDWEARSFASRQMKPIRIGPRLTILSEPDQLTANSTLVIPAGAAFGTGDHATTAMSLRLLERVSRRLLPGWRMLDAGTGSGILALAGKRFGAKEVLAVDKDPTAIRTARENARYNRIRGIKFVVADIKQRTTGRFEIITANLYSDLLTAVLPRFAKCLPADGRLILSGVLRSQAPPLKRALRRNGFRILEARRRGKWVALLASLNPKT